MSAAMVLFAVGNQILALPFPLCPPSALLWSLCTPANTRLITPLLIGPRFTPKGKEVLFSLSLFCHSFPLLYPFYNLLSFLRALSSPPTSHILLLPFWQLCFCPKKWTFPETKSAQVKATSQSALDFYEDISALKYLEIYILLEALFLWCCFQLWSSCVQQCREDGFRQIVIQEEYSITLTITTNPHSSPSTAVQPPSFPQAAMLLTSFFLYLARDWHLVKKPTQFIIQISVEVCSLVWAEV